MSRLAFILTVALLAIGAMPHAALAVSPCDLRYPSDAAVAWECRTIGKGETLESLFGEHWSDVARFNRIDRRHAYPGVRIRVPTDLATLLGFAPLPLRYEPGAADPKLLLGDLTEQFLGAYEFGTLVFAVPIATGRRGNPTPTGEFRVTAFDRAHRSSLYTVEGTSNPYPMHFGLRFVTTRSGVSYWIHGRDLPGYPASHGCIGLYDEEMQKGIYRNPKDPQLTDARRLYEWVIGDALDPGNTQEIIGPRVILTGTAPHTIK